MSMSSSSGGEGNGVRHACAACKHQRKKCDEDCVMSPYFPVGKGEDFKAVHKIFGVSNTSKLLKKHDDLTDRALVAQSFIWEARMWREDPVNGPLGKYRELEKEIEMLRDELDEQRRGGYLAMSSPQEEPMVHLVTHGNNNYGFANQNLPMDGANNGVYTSLLQRQEMERNNGAVGQNQNQNQRALISQGRGFRQGGPVMPFNNFHGNYSLQFQGPAMQPNVPHNGKGQARGQVGFEQQRALGSVGAQIGQNFGNNLPRHMRSIGQTQDARFPACHHHQPPIRMAMNQGQNHQNFQQYSMNNNGQIHNNVEGNPSA